MAEQATTRIRILAILGGVGHRGEVEDTTVEFMPDYEEGCEAVRFGGRDGEDGMIVQMPKGTLQGLVLPHWREFLDAEEHAIVNPSTPA